MKEEYVTLEVLDRLLGSLSLKFDSIPDWVFIAEYGKTPFSELTEAFEAGKVLFCYHGRIMYSLYGAGSDGFMFYNITGYYRNTRYCTPSGWRTSTAIAYSPEFHAGRHGKNGIDPIKPEDIGALAGYIRAMYDGEDTDDLTTPGDYSCSNAVAKTIKNAAFNVSHFIRVISFSPTNDRVAQIAFKQNSVIPELRWRLLTATGWSPWIDYSGGSGSFTETDPTVPKWAKQSTKPKYTAAEVGAYTKAETNTYVDAKTESLKSDLEGLRQQLNEEAHFRGYLSTNAKIQELAATPNDFAYSAESGTKWVYDAENGWQDTGTPVPDQLTPASDVTPLVDGIAHPGTSNEYARGDHRHPTDTTRASAEEVSALKSDINAALDAIIAIQNELIGGDGS